MIIRPLPMSVKMVVLISMVDHGYIMKRTKIKREWLVDVLNELGILRPNPNLENVPDEFYKNRLFHITQHILANSGTFTDWQAKAEKYLKDNHHPDLAWIEYMYDEEAAA